MSFIDKMPAIIEKRTSGTTMNFSRFRKMMPMGLMYVLMKSAWLCRSMPANTASSRAMPICVVRDNPHANRSSNSMSTRQMSWMVESSTRSLVECGSTMRGPMLAIWMPG